MTTFQDGYSPNQDTALTCATANLLKINAEYSSVPWHVDRNRIASVAGEAPMKKSFLLILLTTFIAAFASAEDKHQSYISYDDGGTVVRSGDDNREIEAHRNLPVYPGDEIVTARRGRAEVRLSDGNILGIDRTTALRLRSILDSFEGDANRSE